MRNALSNYLQQFADQFNVDLRSMNVQTRLVHDQSGQTLAFFDDSSSLSALNGAHQQVETPAEPVVPVDDAPGEATPTATIDVSGSENLLARVRDLFDQHAYRDAYALFTTHPLADPLAFDQFVERMHVGSGGPQAGLLFSDEQRLVLSRDMGLSRAAIELFASLGGFAGLSEVVKLTPGDVVADELKSKIDQRDTVVKAALAADGWTLDSSDVGEPRSLKWDRPVQQQLYREDSAEGIVYVGAEQGTVLPVFNVIDSYEEPADIFVGGLRNVIAGEWANGEHARVADAQTGPVLQQQPAPTTAIDTAEPVVDPVVIPTAATAPLEIDEEDESVRGVDRIWRGSTLQNIVRGQLNSRSDVSRAELAFASLSKAEEMGPASLSERERDALAGFQGWGGVAAYLRTDNRVKSQNRSGKNIADALNIDAGEFNRLMMQNRLESYYTPAPMIESIWKAVQQAGVPAHGRFLEPGCGAGLFFAGAPAEVQAQGSLVGVECDPFAVRLAKANAPDAVILEQRLENVVLDRGFNAVVGNVPFGETRITDSRYPQAQHIHDYFIVRSLDHLAPGGVMAVMTSNGTMDKKDPAIRQQMMERANLVGAFRLPVEVFGSQGASVTTDILFLQRRPEGSAPDTDYTQTGTVQRNYDGEDHEFSVNQYFIDNPENVLGQMVATSSAFGPKLQVQALLNGYSRSELVSELARRLDLRVEATIPSNIVNRADWPKQDEETEISFSSDDGDIEAVNPSYLDAYQGLVGDYTVDADDNLIVILDIVDQFDDNGVRTGSRYLADSVSMPAKREQILRAYLPLRQATRALIEAQISGTDDELQQAQVVASEAYQAFEKQYGPLNAAQNARSFEDDPGSTEVLALELWDDELEQVTGLADVFTARVVRGGAEPKPETSVDAFYVSIDRRGVVDLEYMEQVSGIKQETLIQDLLGHQIFVDPLTHQYVSSDIYLSGNVVRKLEEARQAVLVDTRFEVNVEALKAAQPAPIPFEDITIRLGVNWIPVADLRAFAAHMVERDSLSEADFKVRYSVEAGIWTVDVSSAFKRDFEATRVGLYGTENASFEQLFEKLLNSQRPSHYVKTEDGKTVLDDEATMASRAKQDELNEKFFQWVAIDPERVERFTELYNKATNVIRVPTPDGSRLTFPGLAPSWEPRPHQRDMVAMAMMGYNDMAAHPVGAGKTFEMVAIAMKLGQLGMHSKPMIAVPNHMLGQISREAKQMYPGARVLMVTNDDLHGANRKRFLAIARNNKWDVIVCTHSLLNQVSAPLGILVREFDRQSDVLNYKIAETDSKRTERQLTATLNTVTSKRNDTIKRFEEADLRQGVLTIDRLGVDALLVDEAHLYKNLGLSSGMNVLGVTTTSSQRAFNLNALGEYLRDLHGKSFGLHFFTGTPIANTMCELYVHNKMLRPELMEEMGIIHFDEWANRFGDVVSSLEALPEGGGFRVNERFARFVNLPEMLKLFRSFADVRSKEQLKLPVPVVHSHTVTVDQTDWQQAFMKHLAMRAVAVRKGRVRPDEDNMLSIATAGRKASLDMRLVDAVLPDDSSTKLAAVAEKMYEKYLQTMDVKGTQLGFADLGTPGKNKPFSCYDTLKAMLVAKGMKPREIAFIHDAKTNEAKEKIFDKVRSGEIRILLGSTEKMGVGTNVQERLCALHNIDCPWRPSDIEQRIGRIARQGNLFFSEVEEYRYTTKDSFDLFMWETNKRKGAFISQALADPSMAGREVSEEMDLGYAEVMAVTTGNPKIREKVQLDDQVSKLARKERSWYADRANKAGLIRSYKRDISLAETRLDIEGQIKEAIPDCKFSHVTVKGSIRDLQDADTTWLYAVPIGQAVAARVPVLEARLMRSNMKTAPLDMRIGDLELVLHLDSAKLGGQIKGHIAGEMMPVNVVNMSKNEQVLGRGLRQWFRTDERIKEAEELIERAKRSIEMLGDFSMSDEWPQKAELQELEARKTEIDRWFASQDFDNANDGSDPFLEMLADYRSGLAEDIEDGFDIVGEIVNEEIREGNDLVGQLGIALEESPDYHLANDELELARPARRSPAMN